ncbi:MAG: transketolase [bacterium]
MSALDNLCVNTLRFLAVDAVERAKSGHPGMPLGAAPMAYVLWDRFLRHNPANPSWPDRDRFVLSAGHGSALLYALLHMTGYDLSLDDLKSFRQWGSKTPGHPERGLTPGVEATTGPLGQGFAMGVGMAIAQRFLAARFNRPGARVINHHTYAIVSDGDLMEGVASEAASLAGTLGLGGIVYLYDDNRISIEGPTTLAFRENAVGRFAAYGWHVETVQDGNDLEAIERAIYAARADCERPSLVRIRTHIGYGSPKQDRAESHGEPLGPEAVRATKEALEWPTEPEFCVPDEALRHMRQAVDRGRRLEEEWKSRLAGYRAQDAESADDLDRMLAGRLPEGWQASLPRFEAASGPVATREASGKAMNALAGRVDNLLGGSADLGPSVKTLLAGLGDMSAAFPGARNIRFGVREHAMAAIANGMAIHGGVIPYASTFLVFSDYMRPALRFAALMQAPATFVFSHDSIALGEDGPTHQPVEHLASLRAIPGLTVLRPADANETAECWRIILERQRPAVLVLARQKVPVLDPGKHDIAAGVQRGAYVVAEDGSPPQIVLMATGSEVHLALEAAQELKERGIRARVVSMPSSEIFDEQPSAYRDSVLPAGVPRLAIEAGVTLGWHRYVGDSGRIIGLDRFGASSPGKTVYQELGFSLVRVVDEACRLVGPRKRQQRGTPRRTR